MKTWNGMDEHGGYTTQSMAAVAAEHYRDANRLRDGDPSDVQVSIAESLCGLLAMQLARYADEPHDDFDDDDDYESSPMPLPIRDVHLPDSEPFIVDPATDSIAGSDDTPEVVDPYSIQRFTGHWVESGPDNG